ncbi:iron ABC transporter permease, partial [Micrococcus luteus]|nr:iron ABC transporter permease [Micrococcus luteus]
MPSTALASPARVRAGVLMGALPAALLLAALVAGVALGARTVPATTALDTLGAILTG